MALVPVRITAARLEQLSLPAATAAHYPLQVAKDVRVGPLRHSLEWPADLRAGATSDLTWYVRASSGAAPQRAWRFATSMGPCRCRSRSRGCTRSLGGLTPGRARPALPPGRKEWPAAGSSGLIYKMQCRRSLDASEGLPRRARPDPRRDGLPPGTDGCGIGELFHLLGRVHMLDLLYQFLCDTSGRAASSTSSRPSASAPTP